MENEDVILEEEIVEETIPKAKYDEAMGRLKRLETRLEKSKLEEKVEKVIEEKGLDRIDKILLRQEGIKTEDEVKLVEAWKKETGRDIEKVLESKAFQAELKELRESVATKESTPPSGKRGAQSPRDDVDYWIAKGPEGIKELSANNREMLQKVIARKMQVAQNVNKFTDTPVA